MELFKLFGRVLVETSDAEKNLDNTDKAAKDATKNVGSYIDKIKGWVGALKSLFVASAFIKGLKEVLSISEAVAEQGDAIDKASQKVGVSAKFYQEWDYILKRNGSSMEAFGEAIYSMSEKVGKGDEEILKAFERIGVGVNEIMTSTPEELFEYAITGLFQIDSLTERAALSTKFFGDKSKQLGPTLNGTEQDVKNLKEEVGKLGGVMSDNVIKLGAAYADAKLNYETAWQGVKNHFAEHTLPGMTLALEGFAEFLAGDFESSIEKIGTGIKTFFDGILSYMAGWREKLEDYLKIDFSPVLDNPLFNPGALLDPSIMNGPEVPENFDAEKELKQFGSDLWNNWTDIRSDIFGPSRTQRSGSFATGLPFVPRDNYPANLHYGERVLTRQEAEEYNSGRSSGGGFNQTVNISTVTTSPAQTAAAVRAAFETARWSV